MRAKTEKQILSIVVAILLVVAGLQALPGQAAKQPQTISSMMPGNQNLIMGISSSDEDANLQTEQQDVSAARADIDFSAISADDYDLYVAAGVMQQELADVSEVVFLHNHQGEPIFVLVSFGDNGYIVLLRGYGYIMEIVDNAEFHIETSEDKLYYFGMSAFAYNMSGQFYHAQGDTAFTAEELDYLLQYMGAVLEEAYAKFTPVVSLGASSEQYRVSDSVLSAVPFASSGADVKISSADQIRELNFGHNVIGTCEPIAISILWEYYDRYVDDNFVPDNLETTRHDDDRLHQYILTNYTRLISSSTGGTNTSEDAIGMNLYLGDNPERRNLSYHTKYALDDTDDTYLISILNNDSPAIISGTLLSGGEHAMVCFGYKDTVVAGQTEVQRVYRVHTGWHIYCEHEEDGSGYHLEGAIALTPHNNTIWLESYAPHKHDFQQSDKKFRNNGILECSYEGCDLLQKPNVWDGTIASSYAGGTGTAEDPFQITTGSELAYMAQQINTGKDKRASFILMNDIYLNLMDPFAPVEGDTLNEWTPIGNSTVNDFYGLFDGNNKFISGVYIDSTQTRQGLFGLSNGTIKNLTVCNSSISIRGNTNYAGAVVGSNTSGIISRCISENNLINGYGYVGGVAGNVGQLAFINDCLSKKTTVVGTYNYVGGVVGSCSSADLSNGFADPSCIIEGRNYVGGIAGNGKMVNTCISYASVAGNDYVGGVSGNASTIKNSWSELEYVHGNQNVGGVAGWAGNIEDCHINYGRIVGDVSVGGVAGKAAGEIKNCVNKGAHVYGRNSVGGIIGTAFQTGKVAENCINESKENIVEGTEAYVGGVFGNANYTTVRDCKNYAQVTGGTYVGGVAGYLDSITDSYNDGTVSGVAMNPTSNTYVGGVVGNARIGVSDCENDGNVTGKGDAVGGIAGLAKDIIGCNNTGSSVTGERNRVGGVVGLVQNETINCQNSSQVTGVNEVGGIVGKAYYEPFGCSNTGGVSGSGKDVGDIYGTKTK